MGELDHLAFFKITEQIKYHDASSFIAIFVLEVLMN